MKIYGFVSVPIKDPIWLIIVKFMHVSARFAVSPSLNLTETNSPPSMRRAPSRVAIKSDSLLLRLKTFPRAFSSSDFGVGFGCLGEGKVMCRAARRYCG